MPLPIWPAPMTPMTLMSLVLIGGPLQSSRSMLGALGELGVERRYDLEEIAHKTVIGDLEDRRVLVLVDRDDDLRILHPGQMLDRARDPDRDVKLRRDDLAGLADLIVVGHEAGIDRRARRPDRGAELVRDALEQ